MPDEVNNKTQLLRMRKIPIILGFGASVFFNVLSGGGRSVILLSLGELTFTVSLFLLLISIFNEIAIKIRNLGHEKTRKSDKKKDMEELSSPKPKRFIRLRAFFAKYFSRKASDTQLTRETFEHEEGIEREDDEQRITSDSTDLIEIHKSGDSKRGQDSVVPSNGKYEAIASVLYILSIAGIAFWRIRRVLTVLPMSYSENFRYNMIYAILLLIFPCITVFYVKMRKNEGARPGDKASHDMLMLLSYVTLAYAANIAANSVLSINILFVLQWLYYAASAYLFAALIVNILISIIKNDILGSFNYEIILMRSKDKSSGVLDSEEAKQNFSIKSLYTIKYTLHIIPILILALGVTLFLSTTMYVVQPQQQAATYRLGKLSGASIVGEGFHFKMPWPIDTTYIYDVHRVKSMTIGYEATNSVNFLWDRTHDGGEYRLLLGNGNEATAVNMRIIYKISDLYSYVTTSTNPESVLSAAAYEALMRRTIDITLDHFLSEDRSVLSTSLFDELSKFCKSENLGLSVVQIILESIHPPVEVAGVYQKVVSALIDKNARITYAKTSAEKKLIEAVQQSNLAVNSALAEQHRKISSAQKEMAVYYAAMEAHKVSPESFKLTKYLSTYETIINGNKLYVFSPGTEEGISKSVLGKLNTVTESIMNQNP